MFVRDLEGNEYALKATSTNDLELNGNQSISLTIKSNKVNDLFIKDIERMWEIVDHDDVTHKIVYVKKQSHNVDIKGIPLFFDRLDTLRIYETYNQSFMAAAFFNLVFAGTGFTFVLVDSFNAIEWEGLGKGETKLSAFKKGLERYKAEFRIVGNVVYLESQIGRDTDFMYRYRLNASNISLENDASQFWTYARGYGDYEEGEEDKAKIKREYTSPLADIIGKREAPPIYDGRIKITATMDQELKKLVGDSLKISVSANIHDLRKQGYSLAQPQLGDRVFLIDERISLKEEVRVNSISVTRDWLGNVLSLNLTFGTSSITKRYQSNINTAVERINDILEGKTQLPYNVLPDAIRRATEALKSAQTELTFENGIIAIDPTDPNRLVLYNSAGLGISTDGGNTFRQAITYLGINTDLLTAGQIHTNNIQIIGKDNLFFWDGTALQAYAPNDLSKFVKLSSNGLDIQNGMIQVKGQAGTVIIDGNSNMHKILATGLVTMNIPAGTISKSVSFTHNLGYKPAYTAYMQGDDYNEEDDLLSHLLPYMVTDYSSGGVDIKSIVSAECTKSKITFRVHRANDYGQAMPEKNLTFRYFVYKEVAF